MPLDENTVQEKIQKVHEDFEERGIPDWMKDRLEALETNLKEKPEEKKAPEIDTDLENDKSSLLQHFGNSTENKPATGVPRHLEEGQSVKIE